jgi:hypothetical protein
MKPLHLLLALLLALSGYAQRDKPVSLRFSGQFDFGVQGMSQNDAGMGVQTAVSFFANRRVQLLAETGSHWYIGDKQYVTDLTGHELPNGSLHTVQAGPQVFLTNSLALCATYGVAWHRQHQRDYTFDDGYRVALTGYFGNTNNFITQLSWMQVPRPETPIRHFGIGVGYRLL